MSAFGYKRTFRGQLANVRFTPNSGHAEVLTFGGSAVAAVPGRSAQISPQGDPISAGVEGPLRRPRAKIQIPGLRVLKRADAEGKGQARR